MKTMQFKTNIKCGGCVATVTPFLDKVVGHDHWKVDTASPDKILTVETEDTNAEAVKLAVQEAGYKVESL
ncbi:heavy-metal-associated domain-containing protein [uncultured Chitinophaga sp.]|uniref:heavy-metal-associated domain-containing protein n=1 Tax=uncultured Chitinophaga sp. TaxID=339340 RepID=UPI0025DD17D6|nr:heavy-metal-associated domain-containing protein [uncultured Chitinophaga sp.]